MPSWRRLPRFWAAMAAGIAGAVWGYRLMTNRGETSSLTAPAPAQTYMSLHQLLGHFRSEDIAHCLRKLGLPSAGAKHDRIERLIDGASPGPDEGWTVSRIVEAFTDDDLRRVCLKLGVEAGEEAEMVRLLVGRVDGLR